MLNGVLFFPITPFGADGQVDVESLAEHIEQRVAAGPGAVFVACGTGEFHALDAPEHARIVGTAVKAVNGRVPVFAGVGGPIADALRLTHAAASAGADGFLLFPPYLVQGSDQGLLEYATKVTSQTDLQVILYHRDNSQFNEVSAVRASRLPNVVGIKDGVGDIGLMSRILQSVQEDRVANSTPFQFFNGLPTAEASQRAYRAIGIHLYSSAVFTFAPDIALAYNVALEQGENGLVDELLRVFFYPLVRLRSAVPGYSIALIKAGVALEGLSVGDVRPPLVYPAPEHVAELARITEAGRAVLMNTAYKRPVA